MSIVSLRNQNTLAKPVIIKGFGLFHGADVVMELKPAPVDHGLVFQRNDLKGKPTIPALIRYVVPQERCTVLKKENASVAVTEHIMAALAGMQVDNCLISLSALEPPICDGSAQEFVAAILKAGIVTQDAPRMALEVQETSVQIETDRVGIAASRASQGQYQIRFILDYGAGPIPYQSLAQVITPEQFQRELANCRTFVLESEAKALQAKGLALKATSKNALVFGEKGLVENKLRWSDELVRHKILDCVGDFALIGCDLIGKFNASRSGHRLNHEIIRQISSRQIPSN